MQVFLHKEPAPSLWVSGESDRACLRTRKGDHSPEDILRNRPETESSLPGSVAVLQELQHSQYAAVIVAALVQPQLHEYGADVFLHGTATDNQCFGDAGIG